MQNYEFRRVLTLLIIYFELPTAQLNQSNCSFYKADENFYVQYSNGIVIQNDHPNVDQIGYDLFQKSFEMQNFSSGEIKQVLFMNPIKFNEQLIYCFCQLLDNFSTQTIYCIDGIEINLKTNQYKIHKDAQITNIQIEKENGNCDQIWTDDKFHIKAYCQNSTTIILNYINLQDKYLFQIRNNEWKNEQNCLRKFFKLQQEDYLSFYNCSDWRIYQINKNQRKFQLILGQEIFNIYFNIQIKFLTDVEHCQDNIYLIESNQYIFSQKNIQRALKYLIKKYQLMKYLKQLIVTSNFLNDQMTFKKDQNEISIPKTTIQIEIIYYQKYLLVKRRKQLQLIFSQFLQQSYTLIEKPLICMYQNNFMTIQQIIDSFCYQIDTQSNQILYYRLLQYKQFIKPSKKYVFQITDFQIFSTFSDTKLDCYKVVQEPYYTHQIVQNLNYFKVQIKDSYCGKIHQFNFPKNYLDSQLNFRLNVSSQQSQAIIDINDNFFFYQICENFKFKNIEKIIWITSGQSILISFIMNDIFYFFDCSQNQIYYEMNVKDQMILHFNNQFIIWKFNQNFIIQLYFVNKIAAQNILRFEYQIKEVTLYDISIIVKFLDDWLIYDIFLSKEIYIEMELKQYGSPIFYFGNGLNFQIVQFDNFIAIKAKNSCLYRIVQFFNKKISKIKENSKFIQIQTIHTTKNLIQTFIYDGFDLQQTEEFLISDSQIYRPLIVSTSLYYTVLVTTKKQEINLMLFYGKYQIKLIEIIAITKLSFIIHENYLYYIDNQSNLRFQDLNNFQIFLQTTSTQLNAFDTYQVQLRLIVNYDNQTEQFIKPCKLFLKNECYEIRPKVNEISILKSKINQKLKINQFFYGSINKIQTDHANVSIQNPSEVNYKAFIPQCKQKIDNFCIFFNKTYPEFQNLSCLLKRNDNEQIIFEICQTSTCLKQFYIKSLQQLACFSYNVQNLFVITILYFTFKEQQIIIEQLPVIKYLYEVEDYKKLQILNSELLFIIINKSFGITKNYFFHLLTTNLNFEDLIYLDIRQITQIQNKKNHYLILIFDQNASYKFMIILIEKDQIRILQQFNFNPEQFIGQLQEKNQFQVQNQILINYLSSDSLVDDLLTAQFLVIQDDFTLEIKLNYDLLNQIEIYEAQKLIRNPNTTKYSFIQYYDKKILIIFDDLNSYYCLYDLSQALPIYDHIYLFYTLLYSIYEFNTTHYILIDNRYYKYYIDEIGYKIILKNQNLDNEKNQLNFSIKVKNFVSSSKILVLISDEDKTIIKDDKKMDVKIIAFFIIITAILIFVMIIFWKRKVRKYNKKQNVIKIQKNVELF